MRRILATSIAAAIPAVLPLQAADAYTKPTPPPAAGSHSRPASARAHGHAGHAAHGRPAQAPAEETHNRPGRGPENDVKVDADDGGGPAEPQGAPEANAAPEHGATGRGTPKATHNRPGRAAHGRPASRPGTGADSGFADADDPALPPEAAAAIKEADGLQNSAQQAAGSDNTAPRGPASQGAAPAGAPAAAPVGAPAAAPAGAPAAAPAAPAAPKGKGRGRPADQTTDESTNQSSNGKAGRMAAHRSMPVAFFNNGNPVTQGSRLVLHTNAGTSPQHTVTLQCDPPGGTHPKAAAACADVAKAGGDLAQMPSSKNPRACFMIYAPVTVTAQGEWQGQAVRFTKRYPNSCVMHDKTGSVFDF
jgi:hypothetical protein